MITFLEGSYETTKVDSVEGKKLVRHVGEDGHPLMKREMFVKMAKARIRAAKELHGDGENKEKLLELEHLVGNFFDDTYFEDFVKAKKERDSAYREINTRLGEIVKELKSAKVENEKALKKAQKAHKEVVKAQLWLKEVEKLSKKDPNRSSKIEDAKKAIERAQQAQIKPMNSYTLHQDRVDRLQEKYFEEKMTAGQERLEPEIKYRAAFEKYYWHNIQKAKQINALLVQYVDPNSKPKSVIKKINARADEIRARKARPTLENHYAISDMKIESTHSADLVDLTPEQQALYKDVHKKEPPAKAHSTPSTIVDHRQIWHRNAVRTEIKINDKKAFVGHRHGSPSPLEIHDHAERQYRTLENVKQAMTAAAQEKFAKLPPNEQQAIREGKTLNIDITTLCLLSPIAVDDEVAGITIDPSMRQYRQVEDSRLAYWSLHGRDVAIIVDGVPVKVKLSSTFMTIGVNQMRGVNIGSAQKLEERVNNRGINHLIDGFIEKTDASSDPTMNSMMEKIKAMDNSPQILRYRQALIKYDPVQVDQAKRNREQTPQKLKDCDLELRVAKKAITHPDHRTMIGKQGEKEIRAEIKRIEAKRKRILADLEKEKPILVLQDAYLALETSNAKLHAAKKALKDPDHLAMLGKDGAKEMKALIKKEDGIRKKSISIIEKEEAKRDILYRKLAEARQKSFTSQLQKLKGELDTYENETDPNTLKNNQAYQRMRLFVDALDIYYNQPKPGKMRWIKVWLASREKKSVLAKLAKEKNPTKKAALKMKALALQDWMDFLNKSNYRLQARIALLSYHLDSFMEWFCKSGEDRTGLLNEQIEAFCIFIETYGHPPRWENEEDKEQFHAIMTYVHNGAPNRETNGYNDGAPGLKVTDSDFEMPTVDYKSDIAMANLVSKSKAVGGEKKFAKLVEDAQIQLTDIRNNQRQKRIFKYLDGATEQYKKWQQAFPTVTEPKQKMLETEMKHLKDQVEAYQKDKDPAVQKKAKLVSESINSLSSDEDLKKEERKELLSGYDRTRSSDVQMKEVKEDKEKQTNKRRFTQ